ncbi:hypothetical protein Tco_0934909 [Tanacetum coccineum]
MAAEKLRHASLFSSYRRPPIGVVKDEHQQILQSLLAELILPQMTNRWIRSLDALGEFLVKAVRRNMHLSEGWGEVINRLRNWLSAWKARSLSIGGRLTLIKLKRFMEKSYQGLYGVDGDLNVNHASSSGSSVGNGKSTCFWLDSWCGNEARLRVLFPSSMILILAKIAMCVTVGVLLLVFGVDPGLEGSLIVGPWIIPFWNYLIPYKVNICVWKASIKRLATYTNLASRGINIPSTVLVIPLDWNSGISWLWSIVDKTGIASVQ